jgi:hypothetical protein
VWFDVKMAVLEIMQSTAAIVNNNNFEILQDGSQRQVKEQQEKSGADLFIPENDTEDESDDDDQEALEAGVDHEISMYKSKKADPLQASNGKYNCPLEWWKINHTKYANLYNLASCILAIPATSAPSERVFSAASNIFNKKRANLKPETTDLLIFLRGNKDFVDWDS